jgi:putative sigma-54 modulation protein
MRLALTGRNLTITPALRLVVTQRLEKLDRLLHGSLLSAQVSLQVQKDRVKADVRVRTRGDHELAGHGEAATAKASVIDAIAKVEHQAGKVKGKWEARKRRAAGVKAPGDAVADTGGRAGSPSPAVRGRARLAVVVDALPAVTAVRVVRVRRVSPKPMQIDDALLRLDATPGSVVLFRDAALDRVQVLVRRADGHVGLVDPDA